MMPRCASFRRMVYNGKTPEVLQDPGVSNQHRKDLDMTAASIPQDFYVYTHHRATTGEIFYVGKGSGARAFDFKRRNVVWKRISSRCGVVVKIHTAGLQEWAAFELEQDLIALHGIHNDGDGPLCNMTYGGEGTVGYKFNDEQLEAHRTRAQTPEWREKMRTVATIREASDWRRKQKEGVRAATQKAVVCVSLKCAFDGATQAAEWLQQQGITNATNSNISAMLRGKTSTAYGLVWAYKDDYTGVLIPLDHVNTGAMKSHKRKRFTKPVKCVETGLVFPSYVAAAAHMSNVLGRKAIPGVIRHATLSPTRSSYGYKFVNVEQ